MSWERPEVAGVLTVTGLRKPASNEDATAKERTHCMHVRWLS